MKSIKIYYRFCLQIFLIYLLNNVQVTKCQLLANLLASNKPIHPASTIQQTARAAALNPASLSRSDFKQPKLDKRNIWTPISNLNNNQEHNQTSKSLNNLSAAVTTTSAPIQQRKPTNPIMKQKSQVLTDMLKAKLQEGRLAKKQLVDVDLPESNLRLVFDLNNLDKLQTQSTQESSQKLQKTNSKTNSKTNTSTKTTSSNLVAGTKGGGVKGTKSNKSELKSVREQLRLLNNQKDNKNNTSPQPQSFHIGYIRASDLRKVINSGFSVNDLPTDVSNNQTTTERPVAARLVKPAPAKIQSKTSTKANLEENDLESISQKDISSKLSLDKKATRKQMISPKQAHFGLRDQKKHSANLLADTKGSSGSKSTSNNENNSGTKSPSSTKSSSNGTKQPKQQQLNAGTKGGVKGKSKRPSVSSRSVPFSTTTTNSPTTLTPTTTTTQPTTASSTNNEIENDNDNTETTTTLSSLFARMAASLSSMTTTTVNPTTLEQNNVQSNELSAALQSVTTTSSPSTDGSSSSVSDNNISQTTNSPSTSVTSSNLISSNDQQQKDVEIVNEDNNSTDGSEDDEDQNNSLAAIAEQLNSNYGGFGTRNSRLVQQSNSTSSTSSTKTSNSGDTKGSSGVNNLMLNNLVANTKGSRAVVSVQPLNLKTSAFVVEDSQSTTTNNNDNEGLIEVKEEKTSKQQTPIKQETDNNEQPITDNSLSPNNNNDDEEFTLISNNDQTDNQNSGRLNQGVLIQRTSGGKAIKFAVHNGTHSALKNSDTEVADDYEDGFEDVNEVEIIDTSKPNQAGAVFTGNGSPLIIRPFPLSATCACAPLTTINNILYSGTSSQNVGKRLRILSKELGAENLFIKFPQTEQHLQKRLESFGQNGYTLFLPSDEALDRLPINLIHHWEKKPEELIRVLDNHIVQGEPRKLASLLEAKTLNSIANNNSNTSVIRFNHYRNDTFTANGARVIYGDQTAPNNGILHILDGMLYPLADKNLLETLKSCNKFDGFVTLAQGTGLSDTLLQSGPFTLFVPSNEALQKIPDIDLDFIRNNMTALKEFLSYHVVNGSYYSNDLRDGQWVPTLLGDNQIQVGIRVDHCSRRLIDANVSPLYKTDIPASNGVVHIVDWILKPSDNQWCENL